MCDSNIKKTFLVVVPEQLMFTFQLGLKGLIEINKLTWNQIHHSVMVYSFGYIMPCALCFKVVRNTFGVSKDCQDEIYKCLFNFKSLV